MDWRIQSVETCSGALLNFFLVFGEQFDYTADLCLDIYLLPKDVVNGTQI